MRPEHSSIDCLARQSISPAPAFRHLGQHPLLDYRHRHGLDRALKRSEEEEKEKEEEKKKKKNPPERRKKEKKRQAVAEDVLELFGERKAS